MRAAPEHRFRILLCLAVLAFGAVEFRLFHLQVTEHDFWARESRKSMTRARSLPFERGWILDRRLTPLAVSRSVFELRFVFRNFRLHSDAGRLAMALLLLDADRYGVWEAKRPLVKEIYAEPTRFLQALSRRSPADLLAVRDRWIRRDLLTYVAWILDLSPEERKSLFEGERYRAYPLGRIPLLAGRFETVRARIAGEGRALREMERKIAEEKGKTVDLLGLPDREGKRVDDRVRNRLRATEEAGRSEGAEYFRYRRLHREVDAVERVVLRDVGHEAAVRFTLGEDRYPGFYTVESTRRAYPRAVEDLAPILLGKTGLPTAEETEPLLRHRKRLAYLALKEEKTEEELVEEDALRLKIREIDVYPEEEVGRMGLEAFLEGALRGKRGFLLEERPAGGGRPQVVAYTPPVRGRDVVLTLDAAWQAAAEQALDRIAERYGTPFPAAVVILEARTGAVRVLATAPRPTRSQLASSEGWSRLLADPDHPLLQRALCNRNLPAPGSVFKVVTAAAALAEGVIGPEETVECTGRIRVGPTYLHCEGIHGPIALKRALEKSCNIYFFRLGEQLGYERLFRWAERFGFGRPTGVLDRRRYGLEGSFSGILREDWMPLDHRARGRANLMRFAIGQGVMDDVTPLQVACMAAGIATGKLPRPFLVSRVGGQEVQALPPEELGLSGEILRTIHEAMEAVVDTGTARPNPKYGLDLRPYSVAGKTGTPQVAKGKPTHAFFAGYWPRKDPRYSFAVYVESCDLHGGWIAAPVLNWILKDLDAAGLLEGDAP